MYTAALILSITDIVVLFVMALVLGVVVYLVVTNRRNLQKIVRESEAGISLSGSSSHLPPFDETDGLPGHLSQSRHRKTSAVEAEDTPSAFAFLKKAARPAERASAGSDDKLSVLKNNIEQQQRSLNQLMMQMDEWKGGSRKAAGDEVEMLQKLLDEKEAELQKVKQQLAGVQKIASRIDDVYHEFDSLQQKMAGLEKQAKAAGELTIELEETREAYKQLKKELNRKQEKLQEAVEESQRLYRQLNDAEDKLAEANLQRVQLMKKVQYLENLHEEFQQVSEANKKLQNELRRIGELESMLSMMTDERELLLKRRRS